MKEIMAIVRMNKVNKTKVALAEAGIPGFTCRKVMGRGKGMTDQMILSTLHGNDLPLNPVGEHITESARLIPKRYFTIMVQDDEVDKVVETIMDVNCTGNPGDGKIFVLPLCESHRVRDGVAQEDSDSY